MNKGKIIQVMGPVVDVVFQDGNLPFIKDALEVENNGKKCVMEVAQHLGNNEVRCLMLAASEGLHKDMEVTATGAGIKVPVGEKTLGRLFNVLGETVDDGEQITDADQWVIHRDPNRSSCSLCKRGKDRTVWRRRSRKNGAYSGADPKHSDRAWRILHIHRSRRAFP